MEQNSHSFVSSSKSLSVCIAKLNINTQLEKDIYNNLYILNENKVSQLNAYDPRKYS